MPSCGVFFALFSSSCFVSRSLLLAFAPLLFPQRSRSGFDTLRLNSIAGIDTSTLIGGAVAAVGLGAGLGIVAFTEAAGVRTNERGGIDPERMKVMEGNMGMEDVEVSTVSDISALVDRLEGALNESAVMSEEEVKRSIEAADDGW